METRNILKNNLSEELKLKLIEKKKVRTLRSDEREELTVPIKPKLGCTGFSYTGPKVWNRIPASIRNDLKPEKFKSLLKKWIFENIPS